MELYLRPRRFLWAGAGTPHPAHHNVPGASRLSDHPTRSFTQKFGRKVNESCTCAFFRAGSRRAASHLRRLALSVRGSQPPKMSESVEAAPAGKLNPNNQPGNMSRNQPQPNTLCSVGHRSAGFVVPYSGLSSIHPERGSTEGQTGIFPRSRVLRLPTYRRLILSSDLPAALYRAAERPFLLKSSTKRYIFTDPCYSNVTGSSAAPDCAAEPLASERVSQHPYHLRYMPDGSRGFRKGQM